MRHNTPFSSNTGLNQRGCTHGKRTYQERRKSAPTPIKWNSSEGPTIGIVRSVGIGVFERDIIKTVGIDNPGKLPWFVIDYITTANWINVDGSPQWNRRIVTRLQDWYFPLYEISDGLTVRTSPTEIRIAKASPLTMGDKKMIELAVGKLLGVAHDTIGDP